MIARLPNRQHSFVPSKVLRGPLLGRRCFIPAANARDSSPAEADVIVVGAGIVGISISRQILHQSGGNCTVHLVDCQAPGCATGAGQGYVWMAHRQAGTPAWDLARWSCQLWRESLTPELRSAVEWQDMGSLLLASDALEKEQLEERAAQLQGEGLSPILLDSRELQEAEPDLQVSDSMSGLLLQTDAQISGRLAAKTLQLECTKFGSRFTFGKPVTVKSIDINSSGHCTGVTLDDETRMLARRGVVLSAGALSGDLLAVALQNERWRNVIQPRKGHLLELVQDNIVLNNGLMEIGYAKHYKSADNSFPVESANTEANMAITFTATMSASGSMLLGSSREFSGFSSHRDEAVEKAILARAEIFLPMLAGLHPGNSETRVGLRPYSSCGPIIGPAENCGNLFIATGHEGSGLTLAPATACLIAAMVLEEKQPSIAESFSPEGVLGH